MSQAARVGGVLLALALFVGLTVHRLPSPDIWWHLANGREVTGQHHIPQTDPFSFTAAGQPWQNDEWLFSCMAFEIHSLGGPWLLHLCKSLLLLAALAVGVYHSQERTRAHPLGLALVAAGCLCFAESQYFFDVRPQLFTYLFATLFAWLVFRYVEQGQTRLLYALPVLTCLWSNLHPGVLAGPFMLLFACVGLTLDPKRRGLARGLLACTVLSLAAATLNVVGPSFLLFPFRLWHSVWSQHLNEWGGLVERTASGWTIAPANQAYLAYLVVTVAAMLIARSRLAKWELSVYLAFALLSLTGWRHVPLFCFLSVPLWGVLLSPAWKRLKPLPDWSWWAVSGAAVLVVGIRLGAPDVGRQSMENQLFPRWACDFLAANHLPAHLFHPYGWGGYLLWRLSPEYQVFIDGRAIQAYPAQVYTDYLDAAYQSDRVDAVLDRYQVDTVVCFQDLQWNECSARLFVGNPRWMPIYQDDLARIFIRHTPDNEALVPHLVFPPSPYRYRQLAAHSQPDEARRLLLAALDLDAHDTQTLLSLGTAAFQQGDASAGERWTRQALAEDPTLVTGWLNLAVSAARQGDFKAAVDHVHHALAIDPSNTDALQLSKNLQEHPHP